MPKRLFIPFPNDFVKRSSYGQQLDVHAHLPSSTSATHVCRLGSNAITVQHHTAIGAGILVQGYHDTFYAASLRLSGLLLCREWQRIPSLMSRPSFAESKRRFAQPTGRPIYLALLSARLWCAAAHR